MTGEGRISFCYECAKNTIGSVSEGQGKFRKEGRKCAPLFYMDSHKFKLILPILVSVSAEIVNGCSIVAFPYVEMTAM
jgi:hypothetical protein